MIKVEAKEKDILLDKKDHFVGHFTWIKGIIHNEDIAIKTCILWKAFQDIQSKSYQKQREMNRNQIQWETLILYKIKNNKWGWRLNTMSQRQSLYPYII